MQPPPLFFILSDGVFSSSFFSPSNPASVHLVSTSSPNSSDCSTSRALSRWLAAVRVDVRSVDWFLYGVVFKPQRQGAVQKKTSSWAPVTVQGWRGQPVVGAEGPGCNMITVNFASLISATETDGGERPLPHHPLFCLQSGSVADARLSARTLLKTTPGCFLRI